MWHSGHMKVRGTRWVIIGLALAAGTRCGLAIDSAVPDEAETTLGERPTTSESTTTTAKPSTTSTTAATTEATAAKETTSKETPAPAAPAGQSGDAEPDLLFDFGEVRGWAGLGTDQVTIEFDRYQLDDGRQGPSLTEEVTLAGATDLSWLNQNPRLRTYVLSPAVEALALDPTWLVEACAGADFPLPVRYQTVNLEEFLSKYSFVGLSFDDRGQIIRLRDQTAC